MRQKIFDLIDTKQETLLNNTYDFFMMAAILLSLFPLAFKETNTVFLWIDRITVCIFIVDYLLRLITADFHLQKSVRSFFLYPLTPMAVVDLLSILPSLTVLNSSFKLFRMFRLLRTLKVLRAFRFLRYSKSFEIVANVFKTQRKVLSAVATLAVGYVLISALVIYNVEPDSFATFFDAVYWATISLTTVGYGDIYPVTTVGRIVTMVSSIFGIAVVALPAGVITAGYMSEIEKNSDK